MLQCSVSRSQRPTRWWRIGNLERLVRSYRSEQRQGDLGCRCRNGRYGDWFSTARHGEGGGAGQRCRKKALREGQVNGVTSGVFDRSSGQVRHGRSRDGNGDSGLRLSIDTGCVGLNCGVCCDGVVNGWCVVCDGHCICAGDALAQNQINFGSRRIPR